MLTCPGSTYAIQQADEEPPRVLLISYPKSLAP